MLPGQWVNPEPRHGRATDLRMRFPAFVAYRSIRYSDQERDVFRAASRSDCTFDVKTFNIADRTDRCRNVPAPPRPPRSRIGGGEQRVHPRV